MLKGPLNRLSIRSRGLGQRFSTANGRFSTGFPGNGPGFPHNRYILYPEDDNPTRYWGQAPIPGLDQEFAESSLAPAC